MKVLVNKLERDREKSFILISKSQKKDYLLNISLAVKSF
jgi:hypothetical protein